jgi:hypothetical protein
MKFGSGRVWLRAEMAKKASDGVPGGGRKNIVSCTCFRLFDFKTEIPQNPSKSLLEIM